MIVLEFLETVTKRVHRNFSWLMAACMMMLLGLFIAEKNMGLLSVAWGSARAAVRMGKEVGELSLELLLLCFCYFVFRKGYVWAKNRGALSGLKEKAVRLMTAVLRNLHAFLGVVGVCLVAVHTYIMWDVAQRKPIVLYSGLAAGGLFFLLGVLGVYLHYRPVIHFLRKSHRWLAFLVFVAAIVHKING